MEKYVVLEYAYSYGFYIQHARRFMEEEKKDCAEWFREIGFVGMGESIELTIDTNNPYIQALIKSRPSDGSFRGCDNVAWIITQEEKETILAENNAFLAEKKAREAENNIAHLKRRIEACERQQREDKLYTSEEAVKKREQYINIHNEGREGYVPHFYTIDEYIHALEELNNLTHMPTT